MKPDPKKHSAAKAICAQTNSGDLPGRQVLPPLLNPLLQDQPEPVTVLRFAYGGILIIAVCATQVITTMAEASAPLDTARAFSRTGWI